MKKIRISLTVILTLLLTFCISTVSYADTKNTVPQPVSEQQDIEVLRGEPCRNCHNGTIIVSYKYSEYVYDHSYICSDPEHIRCTVQVWKRDVLKTRKCNNCDVGSTTRTTETDKRHISNK